MPEPSEAFQECWNNLIPSSKLTWLAGKTPFLIGNTSSTKSIHFDYFAILVDPRVSQSVFWWSGPGSLGPFESG